MEQQQVAFLTLIIKMLDGEPWANFNQSVMYGKAVLADGSIIALRDYTGGCNTDFGNAPLIIYVDGLKLI